MFSSLAVKRQQSIVIFIIQRTLFILIDAPVLIVCMIGAFGKVDYPRLAKFDRIISID
jgi:hypothetical protein